VPKAPIAFLAAVAWTALAACQARPDARPNAAAGESALAILHVNVVDVAGGVALSDRTVLVAGGRIERVAPAGADPPPGGARVVAGSGRWLVPGLWDMHAHTSRPERDLALSLANGITAIRDMGGEAPGNPARGPGTFSVAWETLRPVRDDIAAGRTRGPRLFGAGVMLDAPKPYAGTRGVADATDARRIVRELQAQRVDFIKVGSGVTRDAYAGLVEEAGRAGLSVAGHVPSGLTAIEVAEAGQASVEHVMGLPGSCFADAGPDASCTTTLRRLAAKGIASVPTLVAWRGRLLATDSEVRNKPELRYVPDLASLWAADAPSPAPATIEGNRRTFAQFQGAVGAMRSAGVRILAGTDSANAYVVPGFALHDELRLLVASGLTPAEALAAATVSPARFFGLGGEVGTIAVGQRADLVLLDANPLTDIENTSRISAVILKGELLDRAVLDRMLAALDARRRP
jgi:imidazolonepropionase-like amidohydrolase